MIIFVVILCFVSKFAVKSENTEMNSVVIPIEVVGKRCVVKSIYNLTAGSTVTLKIRSDYYITKSEWRYPRGFIQFTNEYNVTDCIEMEHTNTMQYTITVFEFHAGTWHFTFTFNRRNLLNKLKCSKRVLHCQLIANVKTLAINLIRKEVKDCKTANQNVVVCSILGVLVVVLAAYIVYSKIQERQKGTLKDISQRPPLPLPRLQSDAGIIDGIKPPTDTSRNTSPRVRPTKKPPPVPSPTTSPRGGPKGLIPPPPLSPRAQKVGN